MNTLVFTGYTFEELKKNFQPLLKLCDYLVDGPYIKDRKSLCCFTGSGNQRFLQLENGEIKEDLTDSFEYKADNYSNAEVIIEGGQIKIPGFFDLKE